ncbi:MAG: hypothetical protein LH613_09985, partial [Chamaesiphon sp.]|nr:hypothetical protein [Chamaesiphon sp.]
MKTSNQYLNWLAITASGLCATLLLVTGAQAADSITTTSKSATATFAQHSPNQLIALRKKKRLKKKAKQKAKTTAIVAPSNTSPTDLTQTTPPPAPPTPPTPPAPTEVPPAVPAPAPVEAPKAVTPVPNQFSLT